MFSTACSIYWKGHGTRSARILIQVGRCYTASMIEKSSEHQPRTFVIGTAGHVDHGKSTLVRRLTGIDPDRLQEEKSREMTIDLGFAWLDLPGGLRVSIVDVPGHERFIKNMLAGAGGLDGALLIVAADEGPMPQTHEHLAILDLLGVSTGFIVITKADMVDQEWLELVVEETREAVQGSTFENAEIVTVSATTGEGVDNLLAMLADLLTRAEPDHRSGIARLPVDRVFSVTGFGTVVTGTLLGAPVSIGQELEVVPPMLRGRVRGLQSHEQKVETALPGSRTAINLSGIDREAIKRGDVLTIPGRIVPTRLIDARLRLVENAPQPIEQNHPVDLFSGAAESPGYVTLLDSEQILPGGEGWVQIRLDREMALVEGDLFIVRQASPSLTIGGGSVLNPHPRRHRRFRTDVIQELETRESGTAADRLLQTLADGPIQVAAACEAAGLAADERESVIADLVDQGQVVRLGASLLARSSDIVNLATMIGESLDRYHQEFPLRSGMPREDVRRRTGLTARVFDAVVTHLAVNERVRETAGLLARVAFQVNLTPAQQQRADRYLAALDANPVAPPAPSVYEIDAELLGALAANGKLVRMADNVVYSTGTLETIRNETLQLIEERGQLTLAEFRDHFGSSRRYAQAVLEHFDQERVTRRVGDARVRGSG